MIEALRSHVDPAAVPVLFLCGGPAAQATALELAQARCPELFICDPLAERAKAAVAALNELEGAADTVLTWEAMIEIPAAVGIVVSALPAEGAEPPGLVGLRGGTVMADLPLVPQPSPPIALAAAAGPVRSTAWRFMPIGWRLISRRGQGPRPIQTCSARHSTRFSTRSDSSKSSGRADWANCSVSAKSRSATVSGGR